MMLAIDRYPSDSIIMRPGILWFVREPLVEHEIVGLGVVKGKAVLDGDRDDLGARNGNAQPDAASLRLAPVREGPSQRGVKHLGARLQKRRVVRRNRDTAVLVGDAGENVTIAVKGRHSPRHREEASERTADDQAETWQPRRDHRVKWRCRSPKNHTKRPQLIFRKIFVGLSSMADDIVGEASAASVAVPMPVEAEPFVATDGQQGVSASVSSDDASNAMPISSDEASKPIVGGDEAAMICEVSVPQDAAFVPSVTPIETTADLGPPLQDAPPPLQGAPLQDAPLQAAPLQDAPPQDAPPQDAPLQDAPLQDAPTQTKASDSDSDSDDDFGIPDRFRFDPSMFHFQKGSPCPCSGLYNDDDEDGDEDVGLSRRGGTGTGGATSGAPLRTTHELAKLPAVAPLPFSRLPDDHVMEPLGVVHGTLDDLVIVATGGPRPSHPLDAGSLLCFENRHVIGEVTTSLFERDAVRADTTHNSNGRSLRRSGPLSSRCIVFGLIRMSIRSMKRAPSLVGASSLPQSTQRSSLQSRSSSSRDPTRQTSMTKNPMKTYAPYLL